MDAGVKERWVAALRSGEYKQTTGYLKTDYGYCCLGVLCDIHDKEQAGSGVNWEAGQDEDRLFWSYLTCEGTLPERVMDWAQLDNHNPEIEGDSLAELNDGGKSFAHIADLIELNF